MSIGIILQARLTSRRFPNKVLSNLNNKPIISIIIDELHKMDIPLYVAIPETPENDFLETYIKEHHKKVIVYRGHEIDVLGRFLNCANKYGIDPIIRVCGDTPFIKFEDIWHNFQRFSDQGEFSYGNGSWIFSLKDLQDANDNCPDAESREHVVRPMFKSIDYKEDIQRLGKYCLNL